MTKAQESGTDLDQQVVDLVDDLARRMREGESVDLEAFLAEHAHHAHALRELFPALELLAQMSVVEGDASVSAAGPAPRPADSSAPLEGVLGDFRIVREIGRGGMGVVYEAEQISLKRRVALKVLPFAAVLDPKQLQRFKNEAQAAASLKHPNIVAIHSVGCERAVHFYAMDYIEGRTLAEVICQLREVAAPASGDGPDYGHPGTELTPDRAAPNAAEADTKREIQAGISTLGTIRSPEFFRAVANLGIQAAEALEHAHQMGVVHRDIKPSNLMVDTAGHLWITDFGLVQTRDDTNLTMTGDLLGTLRYMSPEQAAGHSRSLSHHADIYSLGVTLFELLTLQPAFQGSNRHKLVHDIIDGKFRRPRDLNAAVPRDLDTIVLKAAALEPQRRYRTAQELADDLRRFLEDKPIRARRPSLAGRLAKWSHRHLTAVWSAVALLLLTTAGLAVSTALIGREQSQTARALARAEENLRDARDTVNSYLIRVSEEELLDVPPMQRLRQQLLRLALVYYERFVFQHSEDPTLQAELSDALFRVGSITAETDSTEGGLQRALKLHRDALEIRERLVEEQPDASEHKERLALSYSAIGALEWSQGSWHEARDTLQKAARIWEELAAGNLTAGGYGRDLARSYGNLGVLEDQSGNPDAAVGWYRKAIAILKPLAANEDPQDPDVTECLAACYEALATSQKKTDDFDKAQRSQRSALGLRELLVERYPESTSHQLALAFSYLRAGELQTEAGNPNDAISSHQKALEIGRRLVEENPGVIEYRASLVQGYRSLAGLQRMAGRPADAVDALRRAAEIAAEVAGANAAVYVGRSQLAAICLDLGEMQGDFVELTGATSLRRKVHEVMQGLAAEDPANSTYRLGLAYSCLTLGALQRATGNLDDSLDMFLQSKSISEELAAEHPAVLAYRIVLAVACGHVAQGQRAIGEVDKAWASQGTAVGIHESLVAQDPASPLNRYYLANAYQELSMLEHDLGRAEEAEASAFKARRILRELAAEDPTCFERPLGSALEYHGLGGPRGKMRNADETRSAPQEFFRRLPALVDEAPPYHGPNLDRVLAWRMAMSPVATRCDPGRPVEPAEEAARFADPCPMHSDALGIVQYRAGDWRAAVDTLEKSIDVRLRRNGADLFCLAMAHWRLGEEGQARKWHRQAVQWMDGNSPNDPELRRYRAQAEALLGLTKAAP
jgi:serine/threonine protein kinase